MQMPDDGMQFGPGPVLTGNETVLVVDDSEEVRNFLNFALTQFGYNVICAVDGMDGLEKYTENKGRIHVMLLDVFMPKLTGIELFKEINKLGSNSKTLFMSGYTEAFEIHNQQDEIKCSKFIAKPFEIKMLLKEMREVLDD
jgi:DNA-binding NtrC family response regulator